MPSIFTRIISGEIPCYKIAENEYCFAFLDISPLRKGHVLVVPKKEVDDIFDLDNDTYNQLFAFAQLVSKAIKLSVNCKRISMHVIGLEVPHAHIHLIPINSMSDCNFAGSKLRLDKTEFEEIAAKISSNFNAKSIN